MLSTHVRRAFRNRQWRVAIVSGQCWISVLCAEMSPRLPLFQVRVVLLFFLSSVAPNIRKVSYALSMMDAVLVGQIGFMSKG